MLRLYGAVIGDTVSLSGVIVDPESLTEIGDPVLLITDQPYPGSVAAAGLPSGIVIAYDRVDPATANVAVSSRGSTHTRGGGAPHIVIFSRVPSLAICTDKSVCATWLSDGTGAAGVAQTLLSVLSQDAASDVVNQQASAPACQLQSLACSTTSGSA